MKNPFPGPQPYRASDRHRFHGREELAYRLESSILANRCVTVYGPSGAGKSSLVQAAVLPSLIASSDVRVVRVDGWPEDHDPAAWLADAVHTALGLGERPADLSATPALLAAARRAARRSPRLVIVYLDQMEQLLYPSRSPAASLELFDAVSHLAELPLRNLRVVLSLREDYLGRFRDRLRDHRRILDHGFRVGPLTVAELCGAMRLSAASGEPPQHWDPAALRALMLQVRVAGQAGTDEAEAQAAYAQIVCRALFQERAVDEGGEAQGDGAGEMEAEPILRRYLEATLDELGLLRPAAQRLLEDHLVTADGSRTLRTEKELLRVLDAAELAPVLAALEGAAILHAEEHQGSRYFEIGHDWLARRVFEQRVAREQAEESEKKLTHERARRRNARLFAFASLGAAVVAAGLGLWTLTLKRHADELRADAEREKENATLHEQIAEQKKEEANDERLMAGYRELSLRNRVAWGIQLLLAVKVPEQRRGWIQLANDALDRDPPLVTLHGDEGALASAAWSPAGEDRVVTASDDGTARVWRADGTGAPVVLRGHAAAIVSAAWSPDGARVVTASADGTARVWRVGQPDGRPGAPVDGTGEAIVLQGHGGPLASAAWSPDGARVVTASADGTARVWRVDGAASEAVLQHPGPVSCAVWSRDGARVITASGKTARVFSADGRGQPLLLEGHRAELMFVAVSPDGERVVTTSRDATARVFRLDGKGRPIELAGHTRPVVQAAWSPDGRRVATASADETARVWAIDEKVAPVVLGGHTGPVTSVAFGPTGKYLATASADRTARLWRADGAGAPLALQGHESFVRSVSWSPDGQRLVTASTDRTAKVWSAVRFRKRLVQRDAGIPHAAFIGTGGAVVSAYDDRKAVLFRPDGTGAPAVFPGGDAWVASATVSPAGDRVALSSFDGLVRVFRASVPGPPLALGPFDAPARSAAWSPDGARLAIVTDAGTGRIVRADGAGEPVLLTGHGDWLTSAAWSPDGQRVVTTSLDATARIWKAEGGPALAVLQHPEGVHLAAWSHDGTRLATASSSRVARTWNAGTGAALRTLPNDDTVVALAWSADDATLATGAADGSVSLWSASAEVPILLGTPAPALALAFTGDGRRLLVVAQDNTTHEWQIDVAALKEALRKANLDCLPWEMRTLYLPETPEEAHARHDACERSHGHPPSTEATTGRTVPDQALGPGERRVAVTLLPTDARVVVDARAVLRREGIVELVGKVKDTHRIAAFKGSHACEWVVTLEDTGPSPPLLDLDHCPLARAGKHGDHSDAEPSPPHPPLPPPLPPLPPLPGRD